MRTCTNAFHVTVPMGSPPSRAASTYGTNTTMPRTVEPSAAASHQPCRVNSAQVATQNATTVSRHSTRVIPHSTPEVETPRPANAGVSHNQVLPVRSSAIPPRLRMVNMTITSDSSLLLRPATDESPKAHPRSD